MFGGCSSLSSLNLSSFETSEVTDFNYIFYGCTSLKSLNLGNFVTSKATKMNMMFNECSSLTSLDLNSFDTSQVTDFSLMFYGCSSLKSLNVNNFITSKAELMPGMFSGCSSLSSLNISSFDTSNVNDFNHMFYECKSLQYLNISNFITTNGKLMNGMFQKCSSLLSLDLNSFRTSGVTNLGYMFANCTSLISLYLKDFDTSSCNEFSSMFEFCSSLISLDLSNFIIQPNSNKEYMFYKINENLVLCFDETKANIISDLYISNKKNCTCYQNSYKFFYEKSECIDSCSKDEIYKLEYENICYQACPNRTQISSTNTNLCEKDLICEKYYNYEYTGCIDEIPIGYYLNDTNRKTIDKCNIKCNECSLESVQFDLCISCNESNNYFPKDNEINDTFKNCYNDEDGYFLDINNKVYKPCYSTCKKCTEYGSNDNHKCTDCYDNYTSLGSNCFESCNKKIIEKNLCIDDCSLDDEYTLEYNNICYKTCPNGTISVSYNNSCIEYKADEYTETTDITESSEIMESTDKNTEIMESIDKTTESIESTDKNTES
jgi:surface protein